MIKKANTVKDSPFAFLIGTQHLPSKIDRHPVIRKVIDTYKIGAYAGEVTSKDKQYKKVRTFLQKYSPAVLACEGLTRAGFNLSTWEDSPLVFSRTTDENLTTARQDDKKAQRYQQQFSELSNILNDCLLGLDNTHYLISTAEKYGCWRPEPIHAGLSGLLPKSYYHTFILKLYNDFRSWVSGKNQDSAITKVIASEYGAEERVKGNPPSFEQFLQSRFVQTYVELFSPSLVLRILKTKGVELYGEHSTQRSIDSVIEQYLKEKNPDIETLHGLDYSLSLATFLDFFKYKQFSSLSAVYFFNKNAEEEMSRESTDYRVRLNKDGVYVSHASNKVYQGLYEQLNKKTYESFTEDQLQEKACSQLAADTYLSKSLNHRNENWKNRIIKELEFNRKDPIVFFGGVAHMYGVRGVLHKLMSDNYQIQEVRLKNNQLEYGFPLTLQELFKEQ